MHVFHVGSLSLDYILLNTARTLVPLITLPRQDGERSKPIILGGAHLKISIQTIHRFNNIFVLPITQRRYRLTVTDGHRSQTTSRQLVTQVNLYTQQMFDEQLGGVSRKAEDIYCTGAPGPSSQILVESELLIYFCYFVCIILVILCSFVCVCFPCLVFVPGFHSFDYR